jgi:hypothetical protein
MKKIYIISNNTLTLYIGKGVLIILLKKLSFNRNLKKFFQSKGKK